MLGWVWEWADGGYRILDRDAAGRCQDLARQLSRETARVRARIRARDHARARLMPEVAQAMTVTPPCAACGDRASRIELGAPGQRPAQWEHWPRTVRDSFLRHRGPGQWYLILDGLATRNGYGNPVGVGVAVSTPHFRVLQPLVQRRSHRHRAVRRSDNGPSSRHLPVSYFVADTDRARAIIERINAASRTSARIQHSRQPLSADAYQCQPDNAGPCQAYPARLG